MPLVMAVGTGVGVAVVVLLVGLIATSPSRAAGARVRKLVSPPSETEHVRREAVAAGKRDMLPTVTTLLSGRGLTEKIIY